jgi:hypothetical protein
MWWTATAITDIDTDAWQAQAAGLQADGHECDEDHAQADSHQQRPCIRRPGGQKLPPWSPS